MRRKGWFTRPRVRQAPRATRLLERRWLICMADRALAQYLQRHSVSETDGLNNLILLGAALDNLLRKGELRHQEFGSDQVSLVQAQTAEGRPLHPRHK
jgi:hypothetical protein